VRTRRWKREARTVAEERAVGCQLSDGPGDMAAARSCVENQTQAEIPGVLDEVVEAAACRCPADAEMGSLRLELSQMPVDGAKCMGKQM
jgi:hypothetical protein